MTLTLRRAPFLTSLFVAASLFVTACSGGSSENTDEPFPPGATVRTGFITDHPGWSLLSLGDNRRSGFDIDLANWLGSERELKLQPVDVTLEERVGAVENKDVDMVIATFSITDQRRKTMDFAGPYMITHQGVMVGKGYDRIQKYEDLVTKGRNVCVPRGTTAHDTLKRLDQGLFTLTVESALGRCVERLEKKQVDAVSTDQLVLYGFAQSRPGLHVLPDLTFGSEEQYGIGLPNNRFDECEVLTKELKKFLDGGEWSQFFDKHFPDVDENMHKPKSDALDPCEKVSDQPTTP